MPISRDEPAQRRGHARPPKPDDDRAADGRPAEEVLHDEAVTERLAPNNASPGEAASSS